MRRSFIIAANCIILAALLLGVQEVSGVQFWHWQISSVSAARGLMFWGLAIASAANAAAALFLVKGRKDKRVCWLWAAIFIALLGGEYAYERGYFNFRWVKNALLWIQSKL